MGRSPSAKEHEVLRADSVAYSCVAKENKVLRADGVAKEMSKEATREGTRSVTS